MYSPSPSASQAQSNASFQDGQSTQDKTFGSQSRRRPRPHQSQASISASNALHPQKKSRQRSVSAQRELNASPEAQAAVAAVTMDVSSIRSLQEKKKGIAVEWAKTSKYCVSRLVGLPMELRNTGDNYARRMTAVTDQSSGNALLMKESGVDVWRYDDVQLLPKPNHFPLPNDEFAGKPFGSPLPLGSLVSPTGSSDEAGLVVVMPITGRIAYWDSVTSAMTEGLLHRRRGVEGAFQLQSNEYARSITNIEPAGFVVCTSNNRVIHISLRDGVGKPVIQVTTLKSIGSSVVGGLLGGIASAFKSTILKKEIVAVRAGRIVGRAERELWVATSHGHLTRWEVSRNGAAVILSDVDLREQLVNRVLEVGPPSMQVLDRETFTILDIAPGQSSPDKANVLLLTSWDAEMETGESMTYYTLLLVKLQRGPNFSIRKAHYLSCFQSPLSSVAGSIQPRIYLPNPYRTAFVVFSRSIVLASIIPEDMYDASPDAELQDVTYRSEVGFEDVIDFKEGSNVEIVGSGFEELTPDSAVGFNKSTRMDVDGRDGRRRYHSPGIVVVTRGAGVLKLIVFDTESGEVQPKPSPRPVPVKTKMELAVFFGINDKNLLNFFGRPEVTYDPKSVEVAARSLSMDILCSHGHYLSSFGPSIDIYLESRAQKLQALAEYLRTLQFNISREIRWKLLWDAEKVSAARAVYRSFAQKQSAGNDLSEGLLREIIEAFFVKNNASFEDQNPMREWFAKHLPNIWKLLPLLRESVSGGSKDILSIVRRVQESNEIMLTVLATAQTFRSQSAQLYNLDTDLQENGIANFQGLESSPWTSSPDILTALNRDLEVNMKILENQQLKKEGESYAESVLDQMVDLVEVACRNFVERATWCESQSSQGLKEQGLEIRQLYYKRRNYWIKSLAYKQRLGSAVNIAESYRDFQTLVELAFEEIDRLNAYIEAHSPELSDAQRKNHEAQRDEIVTRLEHYFQVFGRDFAFVLYEYQIESGNLRDLLIQFPAFQNHLDEFLHSSSHYAKLQWIHDVGTGKYKEAGQTLVETAETETDLWSQSVELSIGKLALMIGQSGHELGHIARSFDTRLKLVDIQHGIHAHVYPEIRGAIDQQAAVELAFTAFGSKVDTYHFLRDIFKGNIRKVVARQTMDAESMIDVLTLMSEGEESYEEEDDPKWFGAFQMALSVLAHCDLDDNRKNQARKTIWRRLYMSEDWMTILDTSRQNTSQIEAHIMNTNAFEVLMYGYKEGLFDEQKASAPVAPTNTYFDQPPETLRARFPDSQDQWLQGIQKDFQTEGDQIKTLVQHNLEFWFPWMCDTACKMAAEESEDQTLLLTNGSTVEASFDDSENMMDMS